MIRSFVGSIQTNINHTFSPLEFFLEKPFNLSTFSEISKIVEL